MKAIEAQYLIINALTTLDLLGNTFYDEDSGNWYINPLGQALPIAMILQNVNIVPTSWDW